MRLMLKLFSWFLVTIIGENALANDTIFESFENDAQIHFQSSSFAKKANGELSFDLDWGTVGMSGKLSGGTLIKKELWANDFANSINWDATDNLLKLYEVSKRHPHGPIYKCNIKFVKGHATFHYYFEGSPIQSLSDIAKDSHGTYPLFAYRTYFTEALIDASDKGDLRIGHQALIEVLLPEGSDVPTHHMEFYALNDFISDFLNGGLNQYFSRSITWDSAEYERVKLYPRLKKALIKLGREDANDMFDQAIALFAHYNAPVEIAREQMKIPAVPKQEESDIGPRFWEIIYELEEEFEAYMKANKSKFAYH